MDYVDEGTLSEEEEEKIRIFGKVAESLIIFTYICTGFFAAVSLGISIHLTLRFFRMIISILAVILRRIYPFAKSSGSRQVEVHPA